MIKGLDCHVVQITLQYDCNIFLTIPYTVIGEYVLGCCFDEYEPDDVMFFRESQDIVNLKCGLVLAESFPQLTQSEVLDITTTLKWCISQLEQGSTLLVEIDPC